MNSGEMLAVKIIEIDRQQMPQVELQLSDVHSAA